VERHAGPADYVIDLDTIARELGFGRQRPANATAQLLAERNVRLERLSRARPDRVAWVIIGAPSPSLRAWWCETLGVKPEDLIVLTPAREELVKRIINDPDRASVRLHHFALVDKWFARERDDDPGIIKQGCGPDGSPLDPLHPWNRGR
jgi:hypothetical protein